MNGAPNRRSTTSTNSNMLTNIGHRRTAVTSMSWRPDNPTEPLALVTFHLSRTRKKNATAARERSRGIVVRNALSGAASSA